MGKSISRKFGVRVTAALVLSMLAVTSISGILMYQLSFKAEFEDLRGQLKALAQIAAINVNVDDLKQIPLTKDAVKTRSYAVIRDYIKKIKVANSHIKSIYILTKVDTSNIWRFIIDDDERNKHLATCFPGDPYDAGRFAEMLNGYNEPSADRKIEIDEWGKTVSGYAPIRSADGRPMAVLGIDFDAEDIYILEHRIVVQTMMVSLVGIIFSLLLGFFISSRVAGPVKKLIAGARYIGEGNYHHQVVIPGDDEIAQLSKAFNEMAANLMISRSQLLNYFLETVKSMVKVLEYRDKYTMGHSESVASYADKIAAQMGIDRKTREVFHNVCLLHDIGKVGVRDNVLLKPDKLNNEEWDSIKTHPELGEQILKPILQDKVMLSVIRNHHERFDGKGYPDGLKEEEIPLLVAISTVADSYDAMTSNRAYRKGLNKQEAIEELKKGRGKQFHPDVVDAFLVVLNK